jgi:poly(3-hydroxybutyrate) depolymerase
MSTHRNARLAATLLLAFGLAGASLPARAASAADITLNLMVGGQERIAYLHVPANLDPARRYPLVIGFHGGLGNAPGYIRNSGLFAKGERAGFIVVCPQLCTSHTGAMGCPGSTEDADRR